MLKKEWKKQTVLQFAALLLAAAFAIFAVACSPEEPVNPSRPDTGALQTKIAEANNAKVGVEVETSGANVQKSKWWVLQADWDDFEDAIAAAESALTASTQAKVDEAVAALNDAITLFNDAKNQGERTTGWTGADLADLIAEAKAAKADVVTNTAAANVEEGKSWVTSEEMAALDAAIIAAEAAPKEGNIDNVYNTLSEALTTFAGKLKTGTKPAVSFEELEELITDAEDAKEGVHENTVASNVAKGAYWVTEGEMTAFNEAIETAKSALTAATQTEVDAAVEALEAAIATFIGQKKEGDKTDGFNSELLAELIKEAKAEKANVVTDTNADNVAGGAHWVTLGEMTALDIAISAAESAIEGQSSSAIDSAYVNLTTAITTFIGARKTGTPVNTAALTALIASAKADKTGVDVNTAAANVDEGKKWVIQAVMTAFDNAIATAEAALTATTQAAVNTAVTNLTTAITTFTNARQDGTKITYEALNGRIAAAEEAKGNVVVDTVASNVDFGTKWVTQTVMTAFDSAIATAKDARSATTQAAVNTAVTNLNTAITTFTNARQDGTKPAADVTVDFGTTLSWGTPFDPLTLGLTPGNNTTEVLLNWYSSSSTTSRTAEVRFIKGTKNAGTQLIEATGTVSGSVHKAKVTGLVPGESYQYSVRSSTTGNNWSPMYDFKVPAATGTWKFAVIADPQLNASSWDSDNRYQPGTNTNRTAVGWAATMAKIVAADVSFIVSAGDQVDTASSETQYTDLFAPAGLRSLPFAPVVGNHDTNSIFFSHYNIPNDTSTNTGTGANYYYLYNNILFVGLNTSGSPAGKSDGQTAVNRYVSTINAAKTAHAGKYDWLIVHHHKSTASVADHCADQDIRYYVEGGFEYQMSELGVDFVLAGHDHVYARSYPLEGKQDGLVSLPDKTQAQSGPNASITSVPKKPVYLTFTTGSGLKYYAVSADPYFKYNNTLYVKNNTAYPYLGANANGTATMVGSQNYMDGNMPVSNAAFVQPYIPSYSVVTVSEAGGRKSITFATYPIVTTSGQNSGAQQAYSFNANTPYDSITVTK